MPKLSPEDQAIREEYDKSQKRLTDIRALCEKSGHLDSFKNIVAITEKFKNINWYDVLEESAKVEVDPELLRVYTGVILYLMSQANDEIRSICRNQGNALRQELSLPQKTPDAWFSLNHLRSVVDNIEGLLKEPVEDALKVHVAEVDQELARMIPELLKALENKPRTKAPLEDAVKYLDVLLKLKNHCSKNVATLKALYDDFRSRGVVLPFLM